MRSHLSTRTGQSGYALPCFQPPVCPQSASPGKGANSSLRRKTTAWAAAPALALWLPSGYAPARACAPPVAEPPMAWAAGSARRRWRSRAPFCSWFALSCSAIPALSRANSAWLALSCSISCCTLARSRAIVWSNCVCSGSDWGRCPASCGSGLRLRRQLRNLLRPPQPAEPPALLVGKLRRFRRQQRGRRQLRRPPGDHRLDRLAMGLPGESSGTDAHRQQQADQAAQRRPASR